MNELVSKSLLNQYCQKTRVALPNYSTTSLLTPQGTPCFFCTVQLFNGVSYESQGTFTNKKSAEQSAAKQALIGLGQLSDPGIQNSPNSTTATTTTATCGDNMDKSLSNENIVTQRDDNTQVLSMVEKQFVLPPNNLSNQTIVPTLATSKNMLNEKAQKLHIALPKYKTEPDCGGTGFVSSVIFNGVTYCSSGAYRLKKEAEKSAALEALRVLLKQECVESHGVIPSAADTSVGHEQSSLNTPVNSIIQQSCSGTGMPDGQEKQMNQQQGLSSSVAMCTTPSINLTPLPELPVTPTTAHITTTSQLSPVSFKNLLQEYMQQRGMITGPKYNTTLADSGLFVCTVHYCGKSIGCTQEFSTKKQAEQMAARQALLTLGIDEPEKLVSSRKAKERRPKLRPLKRTYFQGPDEGQDFIWDSPQNLEPRLRKRARLDESFTTPKRLHLQSPLVEKSIGHIDFLSVGEIWKEKNNIAIIGNNETSFVLSCTRTDSSLQLLNTRTMEHVELKPGYRIIGLDADFIERQGRLILQSERCADTEVPEAPDPVLISCGAVILHLDPSNSSHTEVLLKRYTNSQAFINVKAALAQFFRRSVSGYPVSLPLPSLTEHIKHWTLEEVTYIAAMDVPALQQVFLDFWKFKDKWRKVVEPPLPKDLQDLKTSAQEELAHRSSYGVSTAEGNDHPWTLPKGNFRHRMLSTGLHIEKPSECAARELREETGIQVDPTDLEKLSYVDIPQDDNLNPHKGDVARFFLYIYNPIIEELNSSFDDSMSKNEPFLTVGQSVETYVEQQVLASLPEKSVKERNFASHKGTLNADGDKVTTSLEISDQSINEQMKITSISKNLNNLSSRETTDKISLNPPTADEPLMDTCCASTTSPSLITKQVTSTGEKEFLNSSVVSDSMKVTPCDSLVTFSSTSSTTKKKTPLNTDFETEANSAKSSGFSSIDKKDLVCPTIRCNRNLLNKDSNIKTASDIKGCTKMFESMENIQGMEAKSKFEEGKRQIDLNSSTDKYNSSYQEKRGQKRKRGLSEDEESISESGTTEDIQQQPGTSTPVVDTDSSRYQSPSVQGAKHEECSWFSMEEALKISPTFATIYKTKKFSELLMLLKSSWK